MKTVKSIFIPGYYIWGQEGKRCQGWQGYLVGRAIWECLFWYLG